MFKKIKLENSFKFSLVFIVMCMLFLVTPKLKAFEINIQKNNDIFSSVNKNIQEAKDFNRKEDFINFVQQNKELSHDVVSYDSVVYYWNNILNDSGNSRSTFNDTVIQNSSKMTFKRIQRSDEYQIFSTIVPFALDVKFDAKRYPDEVKVINKGYVGVNNVTVMGDKISTEKVISPKNRQIIVGTKKYIHIKDEDDYSPKSVKSELKKLKLKVKIHHQKKPKDYKVISGVANYSIVVDEIKAKNLDMLKVNDKVDVYITYEKVEKLQLNKKILLKRKAKLQKYINSIDGISKSKLNYFKNKLSKVKSFKQFNLLDKEVKKYSSDLAIKKMQDSIKQSNSNSTAVSTSSTTGNSNSASSNTSAINKDAPKVSKGDFGMPLADMSITQDLHDGLAIDYQPAGCYLHPGCVPVYAVADGVAHTSQTAGDYGNAVVIEHSNGMCTRYAHLNSFSVTDGESVKKGDVLGMMGTTGNSTGVHLHFEIRSGGGSCQGSMINPHSYGM